eukprot:SAG31_NODE_14210_length_820_cov_1.780860_2_plen_122_part_01
MRSSGSTLRPPSAAGTELDWESLTVTASTMRAPSVATIPEEQEPTGETVAEEKNSLPPISSAAPKEAAASEDESVGDGPFDPDMLTPAEKSRLANEYLAKKKSQDWLSVHAAPRPEDRYLET